MLRKKNPGSLLNRDFYYKPFGLMPERCSALIRKAQLP